MNQPDSVAIVSGGLDSTTLVYHMINIGYTPHLISFDYGQRHKKELKFAAFTAKNLNLKHDVVDLSGLTHLISNSALTSNIAANERDSAIDPTLYSMPVPEGHYAEESMKATVVPNRNMIMLSIAAAVAVNNKYRTIATGVHGGDHFIYPDCRPDFIFAAGQAILAGNEGFHNFTRDAPNPYVRDENLIRVGFGNFKMALPIYAPFLIGTKADIAFRALELEVPLHLTWSCYKGEERHCGKCGTCVERLEAIHRAVILAHPDFDRAGVEAEVRRIDMTDYADNEFWKTQVSR